LMSTALRKLDEFRLWPYRAMGRRRMERIVLEHVGHRSFVILPHVFNPNIFRSARCLAEHIAQCRLPPPNGNPTALDMGTGSGIQAVVLAGRGFAVTAVDINPQAVRCAEINATLNGLEDRIEVLESDLFAQVAGRTFDLVVFNPPFFKGEAKSDFELAWKSIDVVDRFAADVSHALKPHGKTLIVWSSYAEEQALLGPLLRANLRTQAVSRRRMGAEKLTVYEAQR